MSPAAPGHRVRARAARTGAAHGARANAAEPSRPPATGGPAVHRAAHGYVRAAGSGERAP